MKYLGVIFHRDGKFNFHVKNNITKASRAINLIRQLTGIPWAVQPKVMVTLVVALVRSRLLYGMEAANDLTKEPLRQLESAECTALKVALGLPRGTPHRLVYREAGILPIEDQIRLLCASYAFRCRAVDNSTTVEVATDFDGPAALPNCVPFRVFIHGLAESAGVADVEVAPRPVAPFPPPSPWLLERASVGLGLADLSKKDNPLYVGLRAREFIEENFSQNLVFYTDGSATDEGVGVAFVVPSLKIIKKFSLPSVSVFTAELVAILMALQFIMELPVCFTEIIILSDSLSGSGSSREEVIKEIFTILNTGEAQ